MPLRRVWVRLTQHQAKTILHVLNIMRADVDTLLLDVVERKALTAAIHRIENELKVAQLGENDD